MRWGLSVSFDRSVVSIVWLLHYTNSLKGSNRKKTRLGKINVQSWNSNQVFIPNVTQMTKAWNVVTLVVTYLLWYSRNTSCMVFRDYTNWANLVSINWGILKFSFVEEPIKKSIEHDHIRIQNSQTWKWWVSSWKQLHQRLYALLKPFDFPIFQKSLVLVLMRIHYLAVFCKMCEKQVKYPLKLLIMLLCIEIIDAGIEYFLGKYVI